jgi:hypothetical protein
MLVARPYGDIARFQAAADNLLAGLAVSASMPLAAVADSATAQPA